MKEARKIARLTGVFGLRNDLAKKLRIIGEVFTQEARLDDQSLTRVIGRQLAAQKLGFANNPETGAFLGVLHAAN